MHSTGGRERMSRSVLLLKIIRRGRLDANIGKSRERSAI